MIDNWYSIWAKGHFGYPQPEDDLGHSAMTYNLTNFCIRCGMGAEQNRPFRMKTAPKQKRSHFLQLNWVFEEFFVRPEVKSIFENASVSGISFLAPVVHKTDEIIPDLFQIRVEHVLPPSLLVDSLQTVTCQEDNEEPAWRPPGESVISDTAPYCGRVKYHPVIEGLKFNSFAFIEAPDIVKSYEHFGSGGSANRRLLVSQKIADLIKEHKWRGITLAPIELK